MNETTVWPQWLFLFGTALLYVAIGVIGLWITGRGSGAQPGERPRTSGPGGRGGRR
jgi:hypothetical protein